MQKNKILLIITYLCIAFLLIETFISEDNNIINIVLIYIYIINNQLRMYTLSEKNTIRISIILDIVLIIMLGTKGNIEVMTCGIVLMIDSININKNINRILFNISIVLIYVSVLFEKATLDNYLKIFFLIIFALVIEYIVAAYKDKLDAQDLYDKLRISEEELKTANRNLEKYATTIEELTLLKERNRISREIHDSVGHALSTSLIQLNAMEQLASRSGDETLASLSTGLREFIKGALDEVRAAVRKLKPSDYNNYEGLIRIENLFKEFEKLTAIKIKLTLSKDKWALNSNQSENLYRIFQESLSNSIRHGKASEVNVLMNFDKESLVINIKDNGIGIEKISYSGLGLNNISERISELKGEVKLSSEINKGFIIRIIIPKTMEGDVKSW